LSKKTLPLTFGSVNFVTSPHVVSVPVVDLLACNAECSNRQVVLQLLWTKDTIKAQTNHNNVQYDLFIYLLLHSLNSNAGPVAQAKDTAFTRCTQHTLHPLKF